MNYKENKQVLLVLFLTMMMMGLYMWSSLGYENQIDSLEDSLEQNNISIDSLTLELDTLRWELEIWDHNTTYNETHLLSAIIHVESHDNDSAYSVSEDAVGCLQIRRCMVNDINRILTRQKSAIRYTYDDRWLRYKSIQMFDVYCKHYGLTTAEEIARCWNGGPRGNNKPATVNYWEKVSKELNS